MTQSLNEYANCIPRGITIYVFQIKHLDSHKVAEYEKSTNGAGFVVRYKFAFQWCANQVRLNALSTAEG